MASRFRNYISTGGGNGFRLTQDVIGGERRFSQLAGMRQKTLEAPYEPNEDRSGFNKLILSGQLCHGNADGQLEVDA